MRLVPSKRKVELLNSPSSCIQTLISLPQNSEHQYSLLMQIYRNGTNTTVVKTPSKSKTKPTHRSPMIWTTAKPKQDAPLVTPARLSVLRQKSELRRKKIADLTQQIVQVSERRLQLSNAKLQLLQSAKSFQQIKQLYETRQKTIEEIKCLMEEKRKQRENMKEELNKAATNIENLQYKLKQSRENYEHLQEKRSNLMYALDYQNKRNGNLKDKLDNVQKELLSKLSMQKLSKELFQISILLTQQKNIQILKRHPQFPGQKPKKKHPLPEMPSPFCSSSSSTSLLPPTICFQGTEHLKKVPYCLIILCQVYMQLRMEKIDRFYLNKISYFCNQAQRVFQWPCFDRMVWDYYGESFGAFLATVKVEEKDVGECRGVQTTIGEIDDDIIEQSHFPNFNNPINKTNKPAPLYMQAHISKTCKCGTNFLTTLKTSKLQKLLQKQFNIQLIQFEQTTNCTYLKHAQPNGPINSNNRSKEHLEGISDQKEYRGDSRRSEEGSN